MRGRDTVHWEQAPDASLALYQPMLPSIVIGSEAGQFRPYTLNCALPAERTIRQPDLGVVAASLEDATPESVRIPLPPHELELMVMYTNSIVQFFAQWAICQCRQNSCVEEQDIRTWSNGPTVLVL